MFLGLGVPPRKPHRSTACACCGKDKAAKESSIQQSIFAPLIDVHPGAESDGSVLVARVDHSPERIRLKKRFL